MAVSARNSQGLDETHGTGLQRSVQICDVYQRSRPSLRFEARVRELPAQLVREHDKPSAPVPPLPASGWPPKFDAETDEASAPLEDTGNDDRNAWLRRCKAGTGVPPDSAFRGTDLRAELRTVLLPWTALDEFRGVVCGERQGTVTGVPWDCRDRALCGSGRVLRQESGGEVAATRDALAGPSRRRAATRPGVSSALGREERDDDGCKGDFERATRCSMPKLGPLCVLFVELSKRALELFMELLDGSAVPSPLRELLITHLTAAIPTCLGEDLTARACVVGE